MSSYLMQIPEEKKEWFAVHCKFRCEKRLMMEFLSNDIEAYAPIRKRVKQYASRKKSLEVALIPSHIFVWISRSQYLEIVKHPHVFGFLHISGKLSSIPEEEMRLMKRVVGEIENVELDTREYCIGDYVEIISGDLTGIKGHLVDHDNHNFKIKLESLGWGLMISVDPKHLLMLKSVTKKVA